MKTEIDQVIEILKKSDQTLIWLDSIICPVRQLIGQSPRDHKMVEMAEELKRRNIIKYYSGYGNPGYLYVSTVVLTEEFFKENCKPRVIQRPVIQTKLF